MQLTCSVSLVSTRQLSFSSFTAFNFWRLCTILCCLLHLSVCFAHAGMLKTPLFQSLDIYIPNQVPRILGFGHGISYFSWSIVYSIADAIIYNG